MRIPTKFQLMGQQYIVCPMPMEKRETLAGEHDGTVPCIYLDPELKPQNMGMTLCHEVVHAILEAAGRTDLSEDETFVDTLGGLLHQFLKTKKGDFVTASKRSN